MAMPGALCLTFLLAQSLPVAGEAADAAQLERIRRQLAAPPAIAVSSPAAREGTVFRATIHGLEPDGPAWKDRSGVPPYIRPMAPTYHYEFLQQVTPEEFRQGTLYPVGYINTPVIEFLVKQIKVVNQKMRTAAARREVRQALEEFLACRADPDKPGC